MLELIVFILALGSDWLVKSWAMRVLAAIPGQSMSAIPGVLWLQYAENDGMSNGALRNRSWFNTAIKLIVLAVIVYLLLCHRKKLGGITRFGMMLYAGGLLGNQLNYWILDFVPDMFVVAPLPRHVFNLADVYILVALGILIVRLLFFEGDILTQYVENRKGADTTKVQCADSGEPKE